MTNLNIDQKKLADVCQQYGAESLAVFGSAARGDSRPDSDVDLLVDFSKDSPIGLFELVRMERQLSKILGRKVDLVPKGGISPYIEPYIYKDLVQIYGRA